MIEQKILNEWRGLGWRNPFWELIRYYCSLRGNAPRDFLNALSSNDKQSSRWWKTLNLNPNSAEMIVNYCRHREVALQSALNLLRTEDEAKEYCRSNSVNWKITKTKNLDHHQSSKALIAAVNFISKKVCDEYSETVDLDPQKRCIWFSDNHLHVTARNLDGAIPSVSDPYIIWEIKEYWGKSKGGSKMSDAVYESHLVGREVREFEEKTKQRIHHLVFVDGKDQWITRKSDLARLIDLYCQGLIDTMFVGRAVEGEYEAVLQSLIRSRKDC